MSRKCKCIVFTAPGKIKLQETELPSCGSQEVIAETVYSFVSPGTELRVLGGKNESKGKFPLIPGYSWVGRIVEIGKEIKGWKEGDLVTGRNPLPVPGINQLWGGQAAYHRCEVTGYGSVLKLPEGADLWDYIIVEVAAISWRGVTAAFPQKGDTAVVIGQGMIGAFCAKWLLYHGARVIVTDLEQTRLERARKWGAIAAINGKDDDAIGKIRAYFDQGADIVVEASSSLAGARLAGSLLRQPYQRTLNCGYNPGVLSSTPCIWPRLVFQANYTQKIETGPAGLADVEGVVVLKPGDRTIDDRLAVIDRIWEKDICVKDILDAPTPVEQAPEKYRELCQNPDRISAVAFSWRE